MDPVSLVAVALIVGLGVLGVTLGRQQLRQERALWTEAARRLGGGVGEPRHGWVAAMGLPDAGRLALDATLGTRSVIARGFLGKNPTTRVSASVDAGWALELRVAEEAPLAALGKSVGLVHHVEIGQRTFDTRFVVTTNDAALARAWLSRGVRGAMLEATLARWSCSLAGTQVDLDRDGLPQSAEELAAAIRLAGELGERGAELVDDWGALAEALGAVLIDAHEGPLVPMRVTRGSVQLEIASVRLDRTSVTRVRALTTLRAGEEPPGEDLEGLVMSPEALREALDAVSERAGVSASAYR